MLPTSDGGALLVWTDARSGSIDLYAKRITASGALSTGWTTGGLALCTAAGDQTNVTIASDGADGAFVAFMDHRGTSYDLYLQRVTGAGAISVGWPAASTGGIVFSNDAGDEYLGPVRSPTDPAVSTSAGGTISTRPRASSAERLRGPWPPGWLAGGKLTCTSGCDGYASDSYLASDGAGGVIVGYQNDLNSTRATTPSASPAPARSRRDGSRPGPRSRPPGLQVQRGVCVGWTRGRLHDVVRVEATPRTRSTRSGSTGNGGLPTGWGRTRKADLDRDGHSVHDRAALRTARRCSSRTRTSAASSRPTASTATARPAIRDRLSWVSSITWAIRAARSTCAGRRATSST